MTALEGAWMKGYRARKQGLSLESNPYGDQRTGRGTVTWARAFWKAWNDGWKDQSPRPKQMSD